MLRIAPFVALLCVTLLACDGADGSGPSPSPPSPSPSATASLTPTLTPPPSPSATASPGGEPVIRLPADAPSALEDPAAIAEVAAGDLAPLAPPGATTGPAWVLAAPDDPLDQIAFAWRRGDDPFALEQGFVVWQRFETDPAWRAVYAFTDGPSKGVLGITFETGDLTGDGIDEALTFEQTGGSGACGTWRVISPFPGAASEVLRRATCDTDVRIVDGTLEVRTAVFEPEDAHCCPSRMRTALLEWDGSAFTRTSTEIVETSGA